MEEEEDFDNISDWEVTTNRFVAFLDILGFRDMVMRNKHSKIYKLLSDISHSREFIDKLPHAQSLPERYRGGGIFSVSFSDSILIFSKDDSLENFELFNAATGWLFSQTIEKLIPLKGSIAHGMISVDRQKQIYFGQPIIDSYLLQEDLNYLGIVAHNSIDGYISKIQQDFNINDNFFTVQTPFKYGSIVHINLNWFMYFKQLGEKSSDRDEFLKLNINYLNNNVSGSPRRYIDNTIKILDELNTMPNKRS